MAGTAEAEEAELSEQVRSNLWKSAMRPDGDRAEAESLVGDPTDAPARSRRWLGVAAMVLVVASGAFGVRQWMGRPGTVRIDSAPAGAAVLVDGAESGMTPVTLRLAPGAHVVEVRRDGRSQTLDVTVEPGGELSRRVEWEPVRVTGSVEITSEPPGARVTVDGVEAGVTPLTVRDLVVGRHAVVLESPAGSVAETFDVRQNETASLDIPIYSGFLAVFAPVEMQIIEGGHVLGTTTGNRLMVPPGTHEIELVSEEFGYRSTETVEVKPGEVMALTREPKGTVNINATPWAEVMVEGERIGETPLGNVKVTIGIREFVFRHPELGEKRIAVTVTLKEPVLLNVDMTER